MGQLLHGSAQREVETDSRKRSCSNKKINDESDSTHLKQALIAFSSKVDDLFASRKRVKITISSLASDSIRSGDALADT